MSFGIMSVKHDRKTGKVIDKKIIKRDIDVDEDELYRPLVEISYKGFKEWEKRQEDDEIKEAARGTK